VNKQQASHAYPLCKCCESLFRIRCMWVEILFECECKRASAPHEHWPSISWPPGKGCAVFGACGGIFWVGNILYQCEGNRRRACRAPDMTFEFTHVLVSSLSAPQVSICYSLLLTSPYATHCSSSLHMLVTADSLLSHSSSGLNVLLTPHPLLSHSSSSLNMLLTAVSLLSHCCLTAVSLLSHCSPFNQLACCF